MILSPAEAVRLVFNDSAVAEICQIDRSQPVKWRMPREKGGTGGLVPSRHMRALYLEAQRRELPLTAEMLILGMAKPSNDNQAPGQDAVPQEVGPIAAPSPGVFRA